MNKHILRGAIVAFVISALTACQTSKERAEEHFQTALVHIENGDYARARVEFQNVFKLNGKHRDARLTFAKMRRDNGNFSEAYGQYLRLVEQYPEDVEGRVALSQLALESNNWEELKRHGEYLANLAPDNLTARVSITALAFRDAILGDDEAARLKLKEEIYSLLEEDPKRQSLRRLVIDDFIRLSDWKNALQEVDVAIGLNPTDIDLQQIRLKILYQIADDAQIEAQLTSMIEAFPEDQRILAALVQWHIFRKNLDRAEALLRERVEPGSKDSEAGVTLVRFLSEYRGLDVAKSELTALIASNQQHQALYRSLRASVNFDQGNQDDAIAEMQEILSTAELSAETDKIKVALAQMLETTGNLVGARALIEEVLEHDATQSEALKKRAAWLIDDDQTGDAMVTLRAALNDNPQDPEIMSLMARAHERDGNQELMAEMLALAVENSGNAPAESLRYARLLVFQEKLIPAEDVLLAALRKDASNVQILSSLGELYIEMKDWGRTDAVIRTLKNAGSKQSSEIADDLMAQKLTAQNRDTDLAAFLESISGNTSGVSNADIAIIRNALERSETQKALEHVDELLSTEPNAPLLRFIRATVLVQAGDVEQAISLYQTLLEENDQRPEVWVALYRIQTASGETEAAQQTLSAAQEALPNNPQINWIVASRLELNGDIDGAIVIYERLYAADSDNKIVANNLASLLADHNDDQESLERAYVVARRLRGTDFAPFQDTYGWIAYRLQNYEEALSYLAPAAEKMSDNVAVQFHYAMALAAMEREDEAIAQFNKTKEMLDPLNTPDFASTIDSEVTRLTSSKTTGSE